MRPSPVFFQTDSVVSREGGTLRLSSALITFGTWRRETLLAIARRMMEHGRLLGLKE
jgi:hypothetical protein